MDSALPLNLTWFFGSYCVTSGGERPANCVAPIGPILVFSVKIGHTILGQDGQDTNAILCIRLNSALSSI
jgi:hypothetical protein